MIQEKGSIRKRILAKRNELDVDFTQQAGKSAREKISEIIEFQRAETVMIYMDFRGEVPTDQLINEITSLGKRLVLPLTDEDFSIIPYEILHQADWKEKYLTRSTFGILEPNPNTCAIIDPSLIDFIIIPGLAFDRSGNRLGYGKGCYDRFLPLLRPDAFKLGLAYELQVVPNIPVDSTDYKLDAICVV